MINGCKYYYKNKNCKLFYIVKQRLVAFFILFASHASAQQFICFASVKNYGVDRDENSGLGTKGSVYHWTVRDERFVGKIVQNFADRTNEIIVDWGDTPAGTYSLEVNEENGGCSGLNQILLITIQPFPFVALTNQYICVDSETNQLFSTALIDTKLSNLLYSFVWQHDEQLLSNTNSNITVTQTGSYKVEITDLLAGCKISNTTIIRESSPCRAIVHVEGVFTDLQKIVVKIVKGIGDYEYSIDGIVFQDSPVFLVSKPGNYSIIVRDKNGCSSVYLTANVIICPTFFTPNGDGYNDIWKIENLLPSMNSKINIFDRYGKLLKSIRGIEEGWDGNYNGTPMFADDYWFVIEYTNFDGTWAVYKSHFTLKR